MIEDLVAHLANLTILLDHFGANGAEKNRWIVKEFEAGNQRLIAALKEKHDEARTSDYRPFSGDEAGAELPRSQSSRSGPARSEGGPSPGSGATLRRPGA